jgi:hypothetical protein
MEHNQIRFRAEFTIEEGKIEEYKKLIQEMSTVVEANEPDTIYYEFYQFKSTKGDVYRGMLICTPKHSLIDTLGN